MNAPARAWRDPVGKTVAKLARADVVTNDSAQADKVADGLRRVFC